METRHVLYSKTLGRQIVFSLIQKNVIICTCSEEISDYDRTNTEWKDNQVCDLHSEIVDDNDVDSMKTIISNFSTEP